jgi:hypothetical protein
VAVGIKLLAADRAQIWMIRASGSAVYRLSHRTTAAPYGAFTQADGFKQPDPRLAHRNGPICPPCVLSIVRGRDIA